MNIFSLAKEFLSGKTGNFQKEVLSNTRQVTKQQEALHKINREFATTYKSFSKQMQDYILNSVVGGNTTGENGDSIGTGNGALFGVEDYKGPDETKTRNYWNNNVGPYATGIKSKIIKTSEFDDIILKYAKENEIDPMLCKIIIMLESSGNPNVTSGDGYGSMGLTQITPGNVGVAVDAKKLMEPDYNIKMFYECAKAKASTAKRIRGTQTVADVAHYWNGDGPAADAYEKAFSEIYQGFGLKATNDYKTLQGVKSTSSNTSSSGNHLVSLALAEIASGEHLGGQRYWSWYGFGGRVEWCACFVSYVSDKAGYIASGKSLKHASCLAGVQWFSQKGKYKTRGSGYKPQPGDLIYFDWNGGGTGSHHVGLVEKLEGTTVHTIEGNSNDRLAKRTYDLTSIYISGYGQTN